MKELPKQMGSLTRKVMQLDKTEKMNEQMFFKDLCLL